MSRAGGLFVTATDTGVGKTVVTAALVFALRAEGRSIEVFKPVQSGHSRNDPAGDTMRLRSWLDLERDTTELNIAAFTEPLAPLVAARATGVEIQLQPIVDRARLLADQADGVLVEGAGGLLVPVGEDWTIAELACALDFPLVIVARAGLGTVNHTLLTVRAARSLGLSVAAVVLNETSEETDLSVRTNSELITTFGAVDVIGPLPWLGEQLTGAAIRDELAPRLEGKRFATVLRGNA